MTNSVSTFRGDDFIEIQTRKADGTLNRHTWVIDWEDLTNHTEWDTVDMHTITEEEIISTVFPEGVTGFFIPDDESPWSP